MELREIDDLIARLEKATGPDRQLDRDIATALKISWSSDEDGNFGGYNIMPRRCHFTESVDAAITLVPEGWGWSIRVGGRYPDGRTLNPTAELAEPIETKFGAGVGVRGQADASTPAIALCITALKARAAIAKAAGA